MTDWVGAQWCHIPLMVSNPNINLTPFCLPSQPSINKLRWSSCQTLSTFIVPTDNFTVISSSSVGGLCLGICKRYPQQNEETTQQLSRGNQLIHQHFVVLGGTYRDIKWRTKSSCLENSKRRQRSCSGRIRLGWEILECEEQYGFVDQWLIPFDEAGCRAAW